MRFECRFHPNACIPSPRQTESPNPICPKREPSSLCTTRYNSGENLYHTQTPLFDERISSSSKSTFHSGQALSQGSPSRCANELRFLVEPPLSRTHHQICQQRVRGQVLRNPGLRDSSFTNSLTRGAACIKGGGASGPGATTGTTEL